RARGGLSLGGARPGPLALPAEDQRDGVSGDYRLRREYPSLRLVVPGLVPAVTKERDTRNQCALLFAAIVAEQAFRILPKFRRNVHLATLLDPHSSEERTSYEEVWICVGRAGCDRHRGAFDCKRRDGRDQAWRLS